MANPFLVLGGVAVGVITAGIGVLAVPGWIASAHDSAAMNDLGLIRSAESAAVLQLGAFTDDVEVLTSGELGVAYEPSEGVSLTGLEATTSESWCGVVQSKTGRYFAASNKQAAITVAPGAEAAMTLAGCEAGTVSTIIQAAAARTPAIDAGVPGTTGGSWTGPAAISPAPAALGAVALLGSPYSVAWTSHGVYSINNRTYRLVRSGPDGLAHAVTLTGPAAGKNLDHRYLASDGKGTLYVLGRSNAQGNAIYSIKPDGTSEDISPKLVGPNGTVYAHVVTAIDVTTDGQVIYGGRGLADGSQFEVGIWKLNPGNELPTLLGARGKTIQDAGFSVADNGDVYYQGPTLTDLWRLRDGSAVKVFDNALQTGAQRAIYDSKPFDDGSLLISFDQLIVRVSPQGAVTNVTQRNANDAWSLPIAFDTDPSGNIYFADVTNDGRVVKMSPAGVAQVFMND